MRDEGSKIKFIRYKSDSKRHTDKSKMMVFDYNKTVRWDQKFGVNILGNHTGRNQRKRNEPHFLLDIGVDNNNKDNSFFKNVVLKKGLCYISSNKFYCK